MLLQRHQQPTTEMQKLKIKDLSKRLEEGMLKAAITKVFSRSHVNFLFTIGRNLNLPLF
jgi:hypothetical protein